MTTSECAAVLGLTTAYIRGEIRDGRLQAVIVPRDPAPGRTRGNRAVRIYQDAWANYLHRYWPERASA
jgi:hypothetical protein